MPGLINVEKYLKRLEYSGDLTPNLETLQALQFAHTTHLAFSNLDVLLDQTILLDDESLVEKLIDRRRGGYCFEQNGLLLEVLLTLGFLARPHAGRVRMGTPRDVLPPRTHLFIQVDLDGVTWIVDGGVGGMSLTAPIRFELDTEQATPHETRRIVRHGNIYYHQADLGEEWMDVYEFTGEQMPLIDRELANWWTSTHPQSKFKQSLMAALALPNGERVGLLNDKFTHRRGPEIIRSQDISNPADLWAILDREFQLHLEPSEADLIFDRVMTGARSI